MTITLKQYADYFAIALEIGLPVKDEIITWADNLILNSSKPLMWMIELSTSHNKSIQNTISFLKCLQNLGNQNLNISFRLVIAKVSVLYPDFNKIDYYVLSQLAQWYRLETQVSFDFTFDMYGFEFISCHTKDIWGLYMNESKIPEYYQELMAIGKDYVPYLPI